MPSTGRGTQRPSRYIIDQSITYGGGYA